MSKMGQFVFEMQEDAQTMTLQEFVEKYGEQYVVEWFQINEPLYDQYYDMGGCCQQ